MSGLSSGGSAAAPASTPSGQRAAYEVQRASSPRQPFPRRICPRRSVGGSQNHPARLVRGDVEPTSGQPVRGRGDCQRGEVGLNGAW